MRDRNEKPIRRRAATMGFLWLENNASTKGRPDACLLRKGSTYWCEVKEKNEPFTPDQMEVFAAMARYGVPVYVLRDPLDVDRMSAGTLPAWRAEDVEKVWSAAGGRKSTKRPFRPGYDKATGAVVGVTICAEDYCTTSPLPGKTKCAKHEGKP